MNEQNRSGLLVRAIEDTEGFFIREKAGRLYKFLLEIVEKELIENVLRRTHGNQLKAAKILGINRNTLHSKIGKLKIKIRDFRDLG